MQQVCCDTCLCRLLILRRLRGVVGLPASVPLCTVHSTSFYHPGNCQLGISAAFQYVPTQMSCLIIINLNTIMFLVSLLPLTQNSKILSSRIAVATIMPFFKIVSVANGEDLLYCVCWNCNETILNFPLLAMISVDNPLSIHPYTFRPLRNILRTQLCRIHEPWNLTLNLLAPTTVGARIKRSWKLLYQQAAPVNLRFVSPCIIVQFK